MNFFFIINLIHKASVQNIDSNLLPKFHFFKNLFLNYLKFKIKFTTANQSHFKIYELEISYASPMLIRIRSRRTLYRIRIHNSSYSGTHTGQRRFDKMQRWRRRNQKKKKKKISANLHNSTENEKMCLT